MRTGLCRHGVHGLAMADFDGDLDVIVGEHALRNPESARLLLFGNLDGRGTRWREQVLYTGDEHHDGALAADVDGDPDVLSIGWGHGKVVWCENLGPVCRAGRIASNR